jgi:hypothetical protein
VGLFLYYMAVLFSFLTASRPPPHGLCLFSRRDQGQGGDYNRSDDGTDPTVQWKYLRNRLR